MCSQFSPNCGWCMSSVWAFFLSSHAFCDFAVEIAFFRCMFVASAEPEFTLSFQILSVALFVQSILAASLRFLSFCSWDCFVFWCMCVVLKTRCACLFQCCQNWFLHLSVFPRALEFDKFVECVNHVRVVICPEECFRFGTALLWHAVVAKHFHGLFFVSNAFCDRNFVVSFYEMFGWLSVLDIVNVTCQDAPISG